MRKLDLDNEMPELDDFDQQAGARCPSRGLNESVGLDKKSLGLPCIRRDGHSGKHYGAQSDSIHRVYWEW